MSPERFLEQFGYLADAPNGIAKVRELILQLAVQGKLVPQDSEDEPASVLLERIKVAKERLAAELSIRKEKPLPPLGTGEVSFEVPHGWAWAHIGDIGLVKGGKRVPKGYELLQLRTPHIYIRVTDMKGGTIRDDDLRYVSAEVFEQIRRYTIDKEDIYVTIAGTIGAAGIVPETFGGASLTENAAKIVFRQLDRRFLLFGLQSELVQQYWKEQVNQMAQPKLALRRIATTPLPIPPISEQSRIVAKVDRLMALCDELEAKQNQRAETHVHLIRAAHRPLTQPRDYAEFQTAWQRILDNFDGLHTTVDSIKALRQTILQLAVQGKLVPQDPDDEPARILVEKMEQHRDCWLKDNEGTNRECGTMLRKLRKLGKPEPPFVLPATWACIHVIQASQMMVDCHNKTAPYVSNGIPIIRTSNIRNRSFRMIDVKYVDDETYAYWSRRCPPMPGDVVFTREAPMGEAAVVPDGAKYCLGQRTMLIRPMSEFVSVDYLLIALTEPHLLERASAHAIGSTVKHLRVGDVENLNIPIPPLAEQYRIVTKVDQLTTLCDELEAKIEANQTTSQNFAEAMVAELAA